MRSIYAIALCASLAMGWWAAAAEVGGKSANESRKPGGDAKSLTLGDDRRHWAFQPIQRGEPPAVKHAGWARTPVDRFILAQLEAKGIPPAPSARKEELLRRVTFDLIGLPPTLSEIEAFVQDTSSDAYARVVDRLLASPHYGERWARHWLDVARFAETDGFEHDAVRPHAWRYRDYVISSFNRDKPYDRFVKEQLAGDELYPNDPEALTATAFNLLGPDMVDSADQLQRRVNRLNDMTDTAALAYLGLTLGCARCHDHKFEPLSQKDYYSFQTFFTPAIFRDDLPVPSPTEMAAHRAALAVFNKSAKSELGEMAALEAPYRQKLFDAKLAKLSSEAQLAHKTPSAARTTEQINQIQETATLVEVTEKEILNAMSKEDRDRLKALKGALAKVPPPPPLPMSLALQNAATNSAKSFILIRGDYNRRGEEVLPAFPAVLDGRSSQPLGLGAPLSPAAAAHPIQRAAAEDSRAPGIRTALAEWIASPNHPLTARVMVNRLWQHHFGRGIVPTPSDFGLQGQRPSHPDLLDWLANEFVTRGWSLKQMHKLLLLSSVYQQTSHASPAALERDPENRLFSRGQRQRLEGEALRDSLLAISGVLNRQLGGPGVFPPLPEDVFKGAKGWSASQGLADQQRRSIYIFARRNLRFPFLEVFDAPDSNLSCPERPRSTSAPQSLTLLNAEEVMAASQATAARVLTEAASDKDRITLAYRLILGHRPTDHEQTRAREFLREAPWSELCRALFNLNAFVYVD